MSERAFSHKRWPPETAGVRTAWLQVEEDELPPDPVDLVFRTQERGHS